ncbi:MAG: alpha/beta hydrolase [Bacteroidales bacterium]|nr:alpha/beta hydrolase [Bacteroidales bacterium]
MKFLYSFKPVVLLIFCFTFISLSIKAQSRHECEPGEFGHNLHTGEFYLIRGISLYVEEYGKGEPLLLLHGNGGSIANFACQIPYFEKKYHVIAVDSRAQGQSADSGDSLSFEMMADDFSVLLDSLHVDSCYVLGWSDGGINGLMLAMRHPEKVKKLAITGANLWPDTTAINPVDYNWMASAYEELGRQQQTPDIKNTRKLILLDLTEPHITKGQLQKIQCPTLVIGGDRDIILTEHTVCIARSIPDSYLWIIPGSGHATLVDFKDQFNKEVGNFFNTQQ